MAMAFVQLCHHFIILRIELVAAWGDEGHPGRIDGCNVTTDPWNLLQESRITIKLEYLFN